MKKLLIISFATFISTFFCCAQELQHVGELSKTEYGFSKSNMYILNDFFEYKKNFIAFFDIKNGDAIAELGAGDGSCSGAISLLYDSLNIYLEDIDTKSLNEKALAKIKNKYTRLRVSPQTNTFNFVIGTYTTTNLPDATFDKILMFQAFHEFTYVDDMLSDMAKKLKPNGKLILMDAFSLKEKTIKCTQGHRGLTINETIEIMKRHGFLLTKMRSPENNLVHYANALIFEKNVLVAKKVEDARASLDSLTSLFFALNTDSMTKNSIVLSRVADTLLKHLEQINRVYAAFECWIKDISLKHLDRKDYTSAINILLVNARLYPNSFENYYWLGVAYQEGHKKEAALDNFKKSLSLRPDNIFTTRRIKQLEP